jgi:hypothetical protein
LYRSAICGRLSSIQEKILEIEKDFQESQALNRETQQIPDIAQMQSIQRAAKIINPKGLSMHDFVTAWNKSIDETPWR